MSLFGGSREPSLATDDVASEESHSSSTPPSRQPSPNFDKPRVDADNNPEQSLFVEDYPSGLKKLGEDYDDFDDLPLADAESIAPFGSKKHRDSSKLSKAEYMRFRAYYQDELNLVNAFEAAAESDLSYNLLGVALERRHHRTSNQASQLPPWVSKARWYDNGGERSELPGLPGIPKDWTSWPLRPGQLPDRNEWLTAGQDNSDRPARKRRRLDATRNELEETLSTFAMDCAGKQLAAQRTVTTESPDDVDMNGLAQGDDENKTAAILSPIASSTIASLASVLSAISRSRVAQTSSRRSKAQDGRKPANSHRTKRRRYSSNSAKYENESEWDSATDSDEDEGEDGQFLKLDPRDWSDVLSIAASLGWNQEALKRTADRCSKMFGEELSFLSPSPATLPTTRTASAEEGTSEVPDASEKKPPISLEGWDSWSNTCPHSDCRLGNNLPENAYSARRYLRTHIMQEHGWDPKDFVDYRKDSVYNDMKDDVRVDGFLEVVQVGELPNILGRRADW